MRFVALPAILFTATFLNFSAETTFAQKAIVYDFTASWCGPCQQINPTVHKLQREGLAIQQVDIDKHPALAKQFKVTSIPVFVLVVNGREVKRLEGGQTTEQQLRQLLAMMPAQRTDANNTARQPQTRQPSNRSDNSAYAALLGQEMPFPAELRNQIPKTALAKPRSIQSASSIAINRNLANTPVIRAQLDNSSNVTKPTPHIDSSAANVRIRIKDESGINYGSGTVIQSKPGITYVLTCGHIFRNLSDSSKVDVDIFTGDRFESYVGKVEKYDLDADVGLISIPTDGALPVARLAILGSQVPKGESVISVGCSGGQPPTVQQLTVTALNRYTGPDNIECTGVPVQGRSGGGLLNLKNEVVGVCIAADPKEKRGLYAGLEPILDLVRSCGLESIIRQPPPTIQPANNIFANNTPNPSTMPEPPRAFAATGTNSLENRFNENSVAFNNQPSQSVASGFAQNSPATGSVLSHLQSAAGSKLTIVIESPDNPGQTRVVIIPSATARLIADLTGELNNTQKVSAHRQVMSQSETNSRIPLSRIPRVEDRSVTLPTDFTAAQPYRRVRK